MTNEGKTVNEMTIEQWLAIRREAALRIDPETAEVMCTHANIADPYDIYPDCFVRVRIEQASELIEKMRAALKEHEADNGV